MKKLIAILALTAAVATPAFASDGSETTTHSWTQPGYVAMSDGMGSYASAPRANTSQWQAEWSLIDR